MRRGLLRTIAAGLAVVAIGTPGCGGEERVQVPGVRSASFEFAYSQLHDAGLRVRIEQPFTIANHCAPLVRAQKPAAGTRVTKGAVVTLVPDRCWQGLRGGNDRSAVVPDFRGATPLRAWSWAEANSMDVEVQLAPLEAAAAPSLYENYLVARQHPAPGATMRSGWSRPLVVVAEAD